MDIDKTVNQFILKIFTNSAELQMAENTPWIDEIEQKLPAKFPASLRSLYTRYHFPAFIAEPIQFFSNFGRKDREELKEAIFRDEIISQVTLKNGYIFFARPSDGSYDPICFNTRKRNKTDEFEIVRLDHEFILQYGEIKITNIVSSSLLAFMERYIER